MRIRNAVLVMFIALATCANAKPLTIVEDGKSQAVIQVAAGQPKAKKAAEAIQKYIQKMSGATLEIIDEGAKSDAKINIYVGHTKAAAKRSLKIPTGFAPSVRDDVFEEEGYILKTKRKDIFIAGNETDVYKGTIYGAYAFLELLGCRWYFPGAWGEVVPEKKTVVVPHLDVLSKPDFALRGIGLNPGWVPMTPQDHTEYKEWTEKIAFDSRGDSGKYYPLVGDGFLGILLPPDKYFKDHPEYYAMNKKGKRVIGEGDILHTTMLCLSNPNVYTEILKNLKTAIAEKHDEQGPNTHRISRHGIGISPPDGSPYCYCDACDKASQKFENIQLVYGPQMSEEYYGFASKLARAFPEKFVATMAYSLRELAPQGVTLPKNLAVMYAPIAGCALHDNKDKSCWRRIEYIKNLRQYRKQTAHIYLYEYHPDFLTGLFIPERQTANVTVNFPLYKEMDIKGLSAEGRKAFMQTWTSFYVMGKLLWDADTDVAALKKELYFDLFGAEAGPHLQAWWDAVEAHLGAATIHLHEDFMLNNVYTVAFTSSIQKHIDAALAAGGTATQKARVVAVGKIAEHLTAYANMEAAAMRLDYATAAAESQRMLDLKHELNKIYSHFISESFPKSKKPPAFVSRGRTNEYKRLLSYTNGDQGNKVGELPLDMKFVRDPYNEGIFSEYYLPEFDDTKWDMRNTHLLWDAQEEPLDDKGHDYDGFGWYRGTFKVAKSAKGKKVIFHSGGVFNEGWVWVNGQYVHHEPHKVWWWWNHTFDIDVTDAIKPGKVNQITVRVWNKAELGGMLRRGFFFTPTDKYVPKK